MKKRQQFSQIIFKNLIATTIFVFTSVQLFAQAPGAVQPEESNLMWYLFLSALVVLLLGAIYWRFKSQQVQAVEGGSSKLSDKAVNADSELAWLRRNGNKIDKTQDYKKYSKNGKPKKKALKVSVDFDESFFAPLPVFTFRDLNKPASYDSLPISNAPELMNAIEQIHDEMEDDDEIRDVCLNILAGFRNQNSVEAISDIALYDLSSALRSKALGILAEFDHESVFETILLACADPTREVRAAAARALFHLSFDRSDAWTRVTQSDEKGHKVQMARAAIEGDLVKRSFERLVHKDRKYSYEAFAVLHLLIRAGEIDVIFETLRNHTDMNVQNAILHTIKVSKDDDALAGLNSILEDKTIKPEVQEEIGKTLKEVSLAVA